MKKDKKDARAKRGGQGDPPETGAGGDVSAEAKGGTLPERSGKRGRKDKVLQARVSESMYRDLVTQARRLRVPVSNLVRNILEDSLKMVEDIVDGGLDIAGAIGRPANEEELDAVVGWQPLSANRELTCAGCGQAISKGEDAFSSIGAPSGRTIVICGACKCKR